MKITKAGTAGGAGGAAEMEAINAFAKATLTPEEVYTFSVLLCDNEVDRDFERFTEKTLSELRELFVGKTGITDHDWAAGSQKARIYRTEVVTDPLRRNSLGMPYTYLRGYAYMLRTDSNTELIAEIEGGIKKETSVGCSIAAALCSVCGEELGGGACSHIKGREYGGKLCFAELTGAVDAYEWSFVAVPAQRGAGVIKKLRTERGLSGFTESEEGRFFAKEFTELKKDAALGRRYMEGLRREVLRLSLLCDRRLHEALSDSVEKMDEGQLLSLKESFDARLAPEFPPTQLPGRNETTKLACDEYKI
ncbi:MAG: hypothetical protein EOM54_04125 [Clostridia bacterium]|nr:hypothetical protein [Clostridia bacterium]